MEQLIVGTSRNRRFASRFGRVVMWKFRQLALQFKLRHGAWGWINLSLLLASLALLGVLALQQDALKRLQVQLANAEASAAFRLSTGAVSAPSSLDPRREAREHLLAFEKQLLAHDAMAQAVQDLLRNAEEQGLLIERGDYASQTDPQGEFLRFRMNLPVKGSAQSIQRFIKAALLAQPQLALDGIRFKREGVQTGDIEAQLSWVLFTRTPTSGASGQRPAPDEGVGR